MAPDDVGYFFQSPLHRWYVDWKLCDTVSAPQFQANDVVEFVVDVIRIPATFREALLVFSDRLKLSTRTNCIAAVTIFYKARLLIHCKWTC